MTPRFQGFTGQIVAFVGIVTLGLAPASAQAEGVAESWPRPVPGPVEADTSDSTAVEPYTTNRGVFYHVLAVPAYVLHGATRPLGWAVKFAERNAPYIFDRELPPRGILPLVDLGGPTGFSGGAMLYDNHLFGSDQSLRLRGLYGGANAFEVDGRYVHPRVIGPGSKGTVRASLFSDPSDTFFRDGNDADLQADEVLFSRDQLDVTAELRYASPGARVAGRFDLRYEHVETAATNQSEAPPRSGHGTVDLVTPRMVLRLDFTKGRPRTYAGTELLAQFDYAQDLQADRYQYAGYALELRQYLPVLVFPESRRLALRARLEQVHPVFGGTQVPFYHLPSLGGQQNLRGYRHRRFQNDGSLLLTVEYRYPIWSNWDAVLFTDAGQVFEVLDDVAVDRFRWSYGGGLHLLNEDSLSFRLEVAGSDEGVRTILTVEPAFRRVVR